ncbi:sterile alpha motif domain-containing protein 9-like [Microcaecilia unicolor]|uniref:Sterile alpha motif domain-containing protein 9-like n=1 Tax=Microcaecilia unicolor TaxID=1415580 RepID=A0A6P7XZX6_9AMPH|nr:sterile alpha motif domain-containing protein 9-like [Microcaecilia unicolor]XP_030056294.1 sterile alpha motif domain-containing protein 9-like [Microcaecilia unicolor]
MDNATELPENMDNWTLEHVNYWVTEHVKLEQKYGEILKNEEVTGSVLKELMKQDLIDMGFKHGPAIKILTKLEKLNKVPHDCKSQTSAPEEKGKKSPEKEIKANKKQSRKSKEKNEFTINSSCNVSVPESTKAPGEISLPINESEIKLNQTDFVNCDTNEPLESSQLNATCIPYPFDEFHDSRRYIENHIIFTPESGPLNLIDPVHEFKLFTNTQNATEEDMKMKFCNEVFRFAAACMNSRTNGTIHLGVKDKPHGQIIGIKLDQKDVFINWFDQMIKQYFKTTDHNAAQSCIRSPRFVDVLHQNNIPTGKCVIEVDVVPQYSICKSVFFHTYQQTYTEQGWKKNIELSCFIRDGASSKDIFANVKKKDSEYTTHVLSMKSLDDSRKTAEDQRIKAKQSNEEGARLASLLTGNKDTLDDSYYSHYILVTNKSHESQIKHLEFLKEIQWFAVLEFDPESMTNGVCKFYSKSRAANLHFPDQYKDIDKSTSEKLEILNLFKQTSWIFCNGRSDLDSSEYQPLTPRLWHKERAGTVRKLISFLSQEDIMPRGKFLVVVLLLSTVEDPGDPIIETLYAFYQEMKGIDDILCICEDKNAFQRWKDLVQARVIATDEIVDRCISNLSLEEINGTVLKLKSVTQSAQRFLPSSGSSSTVLNKKDEDFMTALEILCENECQNTELEKDKTKFADFKKRQEEHFYRGGKVSWWNFYYSSKHYSGPFIKRDRYEKLEHLIKSLSQCPRQSCVKIVTLYHHPGCGGTTLAMHMLWELRKIFRCAILKNKTIDFEETGRQVTNLITYGSTKQQDYLPVLLLVDDFEEEGNVYILQNYIQAAVAEKYIRYEHPLVIILNCFRSQNPERNSKDHPTDSVALKYSLSLKEQRSFEEKLKEIEKQHQQPDDFYSFMIMKSNFNEQYIEKVVRNILKGLSSTSKQAQLISFLALINSFVKDSTISVSQCEEFLGITAKKTFWGRETVEDKMGTYSTIIIRTEVENYGRYEGLRIIHPLIANQCLEELKVTYHLDKSEVMLNFLRTNLFYDIGIGKDRLVQDMQIMLYTRLRKEHGDETNTLFSPLIEAIQEEEGNTEVKNVLMEGTIRFNQNAFICQALGRHFYIKEKNFTQALEWAKRAKQIAPDNSFVSSTLGQIYKTQLKCWLDENMQRKALTPEDLKFLLDIATNASKAFKECQEQCERKGNERTDWECQKSRRKYNIYSTAGYLGEIEVCLYTIDLLELVPCFIKGDELSKMQLLQYLAGKRDIPISTLDRNDQDFYDAISEYNYYLSNIKLNLKNTFDFFEDYFVHLKPRNFLKETTDLNIRKKVSKCFERYINLFCPSDLKQLREKVTEHKFSMTLQIEQFRTALVADKADRFSGLLEYLNHEKGAAKIEDIVYAYDFLVKNQSNTNNRDKLNFILANIVLNCIKPKSKFICPIKNLKEILRQVLKEVGSNHRYPEPYFLASLLFWTHPRKQLDQDFKHMEKYVSSMRNSFRWQYGYLCHSKQPIAHFYLGRHENLDKIVHKSKIDQYFCDVPDLNSIWQNGDIWKEKQVEKLLLRLNGRTENNLVYLECGIGETIKLPIRPVYLGQLRSGRSIERVSFYVGFSFEGLIAYDIESI